MNDQPPLSTAPPSVVLTDWAAVDVGGSIGKDFQTALYELLVLSLLYDKILIQDEVFALSLKLLDKDWLGAKTSPNLELFKKVLGLGSITILTHPTDLYPTDSLKDRAIDSPIMARARYIQEFSTKAEKPFKPTVEQIAFYHEMDGFLVQNRNILRPVGVLRPDIDIMGTFSWMLKNVLSSNRHAKWRNSTFHGLTNRMADDFVAFIEKPEQAIAQIHQHEGTNPKLVRQEGKPVFNRSLGYQLTNLYSDPEQQAMQRLIQTTFAAAFTRREEAAGRYSNWLRELLWEPSSSYPETLKTGRPEVSITVKELVDTAIKLPDFTSNFVDAIADIRGGPVGQRLRKVVRNSSQEVNLQDQVEAWQAVTDKILTNVKGTKSFNIRTAQLIIENMATNSVEEVIGCVVKPVLDHSFSPTVRGEDIAISALVGMFGPLCQHVYKILCHNLNNNKMRKKIENAVEFRCSWLDMPPVTTPPNFKDQQP